MASNSNACGWARTTSNRTAAAEAAAGRAGGHYLVQIANLGGYLARAKDPPPGNRVLRRGLTRLTDILLGFQLTNRGYG
jgi:hypothetical protein